MTHDVMRQECQRCHSPDLNCRKRQIAAFLVVRKWQEKDNAEKRSVIRTGKSL
jgi:mono/diheme cytochrome c family protein